MTLTHIVAAIITAGILIIGLIVRWMVREVRRDRDGYEPRHEAGFNQPAAASPEGLTEEPGLFGTMTLDALPPPVGEWAGERLQTAGERAEALASLAPHNLDADAAGPLEVTSEMLIYPGDPVPDPDDDPDAWVYEPGLDEKVAATIARWDRMLPAGRLAILAEKLHTETDLDKLREYAFTGIAA